MVFVKAQKSKAYFKSLPSGSDFGTEIPPEINRSASLCLMPDEATRRRSRRGFDARRRSVFFFWVRVYGVGLGRPLFAGCSGLVCKFSFAVLGRPPEEKAVLAALVCKLSFTEVEGERT
uniref:Uncharacterized protein n=1 Tax=Cannabis sativa TaxID=3483 RepID=A0A803PVF7_CANSA